MSATGEFARYLQASKVKIPGQLRSTPLWQGPQVDGITFSLLSRFLVCRERFRLLVWEGLKPADHFNHHMEYGNLWHVCEEMYAAGVDWRESLKVYSRYLCSKYPTQQAEVEKWYNICKVQFPVYIDYWKQNQQSGNSLRDPLVQEKEFSINYTLPSGRIVRLRGKFDSVDMETVKGKNRSKEIHLYLQENKSKSEIDERKLLRQLNYDLQTMIYLVALHQDTGIQELEEIKSKPNASILGVRYNVIRRPLSGGKGTIVQHKPTKKNPQGETKEEYYTRLGSLIAESPQDFFARWQVKVTSREVVNFCLKTLDPILEQLWDWWLFITGKEVEVQCSSLHWRHPYGVYNVLDEGGSSELDEYLASGNEVGLQKVNNLFPELSQRVDNDN